MKKILIAIPTARYIEADTFKSIYDLEVPEGYETTFQYFYGYRVDQVRNLIADWVVRDYDYLFSVDHDITFPPDTLKKLLIHDQDLVSGVYRQRLEPQMLEIYGPFGTRMSTEDLYAKNWNLVGIGGCGFGCVLVKKEVLVGVGYPQFEYHPALDHGNTISEDTDFCKKAITKGFKLWCDPSIRCGHIGSTTMRVELPQIDTIENRLLQISKENHLPSQLVEYTNNLDIEQPNVVYDIGANALEWTRLAKNKWPNSRIIAFEAMNDFNKLYKHFDFENHIGVLSDIDDKQITFYENPIYPWGNSYYIENENESPPGCEFNESHATLKNTKTLDTIVQENNWPYPDLIKIDVQGAEKDILEGAKKCLEKCKHLIVEIQHKEYNKQAPLDNEMFAYLDSIGFQLVTNIHRKDCDGDYHFKKKLIPSVAYIITTYNNEKSAQWSESAAESCEKVGLKSKLFHGFENKTPQELSDILGIKFGDMNHKAACATASHFALWQRIAELNECAVILEHDAVMIKPIDFDIPDNKIVALGYKYKAEDLKTPQTDPIDIIDIHRHSGAHAYCITPNTAKALLKELNEVGAPRAIDNFYFMRINEESDTESSVPLAITIPEVAVGVIRGSTIWEEPSTLNYTLDHAKIKIDF